MEAKENIQLLSRLIIGWMLVTGIIILSYYIYKKFIEPNPRFKKVLIGIFTFLPVIYGIILILYIILCVSFMKNSYFFLSHFGEVFASIVCFGMPVWGIGSIIIIIKTKSISRSEKIAWLISYFVVGFISMPLFWYTKIYKDKHFRLIR